MKSSSVRSLKLPLKTLGWVALAALLYAVASFTQQDIDLSKVEQKVAQLSDTVWLLEPDPPRGGNIAVSAGEDGILMVDDQMLPMTDGIKAAVAAIQKGTIDFVVNSHYHFDHAGGNAAFGGESTIVAHHTVRTRLLEGREASTNFRQVPHPKEAIPVITFSDDVTFHWNGEPVAVQHLGNPSHTDGDAVIFFRDSNVIHMGDQYVNLNGYPFIDRAVGGSATGLRDSIAAALDMIDDETKVIPGHGPLSTKAEMQAYHDRIAETIEIVAKQKKAGKSLEAVQETGLPEQYTPFTGFMPIDTWISFIYDSLEG